MKQENDKGDNKVDKDSEIEKEFAESIRDGTKLYDVKNHETTDVNKSASLVKSFNYAIQGIIYTLKSERNMKIHYLGATLALIAALFVNFTKLELVALFFCISLVIICEMLNTAVEQVVNLLTDKYDKRAKVAKDVAAGSVLIAAGNAVIVGYLLFLGKLSPHFKHLIINVRNTPTNVTFITLIMVIITTIVIKTVYGGGTPMSGGMPSGHTALGFAAATIISLNKSDLLTATLCYVMALLVAQSRVEGKIHSTIEAVAGAIIGFLIALLIYGFFR